MTKMNDLESLYLDAEAQRNHWGRGKTWMHIALAKATSARFLETVAAVLGIASAAKGLLSGNSAGGNATQAATTASQAALQQGNQYSALADQYRQIADQYRGVDDQQAAKYDQLAAGYRDRAESQRAEQARRGAELGVSGAEEQQRSVLYQGAADQDYNALEAAGKDQLALWQNEGLPLLREAAGARLNPAEEEAVAANAVKTQSAIARQNTQRALELGGSPSDPRYADVLRQFSGEEAAKVAGAMTDARRYANTTNYDRALQTYSPYAALGTAGATNIGNAAAGRSNTANAIAGRAVQYTGMGNSTVDAAYGANDAYLNNAQNAAYMYSNRSVNTANQAALQYGTNAYNYAGRGATYAGTAADAAAQNAAMWGNAGANILTNGGRWASAINPQTGQQVDNASALYGNPTTSGFNYGDPNDPNWNNYAEGGQVSGPGTGTSDSVHAIKRPGTYVLSADTVRAIGMKKVRDLMDRAGVRPGDGNHNDSGGVPVRLSNGEVSIPPEVTHYYGEEFFHKLQQKYHRPVFSGDASADGTANGGAIRRRALPASVEAAIFHGMPTRAIGRRA